MRQYSNILSTVAEEIWAMEPKRLMAMVGFLELLASGQKPAVDVVDKLHAASVDAAARSQRVSASSSGAVAVLPLYGTIMKRGNMMGDISGPRGASVEQFTQSFRAAMNDPGVSAVVIDIDSPGGSVSGVPELAAEILDARKNGGKKIVAVSDDLNASAAYYIASACSEIVVSPSSLTGSIGVYTVHEDLSKAYEAAGVSATLIHYGAHKVDGNSLGPLSDSARADMQQRVDYYGEMFEKAVAKGRKMTVADVQGKLGQGKVFNAQKAVSSGMADSIGTLDDVLARFGVSRSIGGAQASIARPQFEDNHNAAAPEPPVEPEKPEPGFAASAASAAKYFEQMQAHRERELQMASR